MGRLVDTYEQERAAGRSSNTATADGTRISWNRGLLADLDRKRPRNFDRRRCASLRIGHSHANTCTFDRALNDMVYRLNELFQTPNHPNHGFYALNPGADKPFSVHAVDQIPDLALYGSNAGQFFVRWHYEKLDTDDGMLAFEQPADSEVIDDYRRLDSITDEALAKFVAAYGNWVSKDDIFHYACTHRTTARRMRPT